MKNMPENKEKKSKKNEENREPGPVVVDVRKPAFDATNDGEIIEVIDGIHQRDEVAAPGNGNQAVAPVFWLRHEPKAHFGDDTEVPLTKEAGGIRTESVLVLLPATGPR